MFGKTEKEILEDLKKPRQDPEAAADHLTELIEQAQMDRKSGRLQEGDLLGSTRLTGKRMAKCPMCKLYLPVLYLRFDDRLGDQTVGYACSKCETPIIAITRSKKDGKVLRRYKAPGAILA